MGKEIKDLHGNVFTFGKLIGFGDNIPESLKGCNAIFQRDIISDRIFTELVLPNNKFIYMVYISYMDLYAFKELNYIGYEEKNDIRKSYKYARKH